MDAKIRKSNEKLNILVIKYETQNKKINNFYGLLNYGRLLAAFVDFIRSFFISCQKGVIPFEPSLVSRSSSGSYISSSARKGTMISLYFWTNTVATPCDIIPSSLAARHDRSMIRPRTYGPRSVTLTTTLRPLAGL